jgi:hypothetical protein
MLALLDAGMLLIGSMSEKTKILFVRGLPEWMLNRAKSEAALKGLSLTEWMRQLLTQTFNGKSK